MSDSQYEQLVANAHAGKPDAQFLLSQMSLQAGDVEGMVLWLQEASKGGFPDALGALGHCYEAGQGVAADMSNAMDYYDRALDKGSAPAAFHKARLLYKSKQGAEKAGHIRELLLLGARANVAPALRAIGYLALQQGADDLAILCLRRAATLGDIASAFILGWRLSEDHGVREADGEAAYWLQRAASANYPLAAELFASLENTTPATPPPTAKEAIDIGDEFSLFPESTSLETDVLSTDPPITLYKDVLNIVDRAYLVYLSRPHMTRAHVIDPDGDMQGQVSEVRTSMSTYLPFGTVDIIGRYIELKIIAETDEDLLSSEPMSILCYAPGEYYKPHVDYFNPKLDVSRKFMQDGGQRTASAVTYLTVPSAGGGTSFPRLDITVPAVAGGTLWFRNCLNNGQVDERSLHAGDTVVEGEKWVVTKWFRERPTEYLPI
jgi:prolyl 4-hydroxylase